MYRLSSSGDLIVRDINLQFSQKVYKGFPISYAKFGGAARRRFSLFAKDQRVACITPLPGKG